MVRHPLLGVDRVDTDPERYLSGVGDVFPAFRQQDSGCVSLGVAVAGERWFVKFPVEARAVPSLERAVRLHRAVVHPAVIGLRHVIRTRGGPVLVHPWVAGEVLYGAPGGRARRVDPAGPHARFRGLPVPQVVEAVDAILDAHLVVAARGFVAVDLYDGCFLYDFAGRSMRLCDLDEYRPGPFTVDGDRLPGSRRFMAPEEYRRGAVIDQRTTVFNLGRTAQVLLDEGDLDGRFRGGARLAAVLDRATCADPADRHPDVAAFVADWHAGAPPRRAEVPGGRQVEAARRRAPPIRHRRP